MWWRLPILSLLALAAAQEAELESVVTSEEAAENEALVEGDVNVPVAHGLTLKVDQGEGDFWHGAVTSFGLILACEIGDKTFFIAAILSMKHAALVVFAGAIAALAVMTVLSAGLGLLLPSLLSRNITHYACVMLFFYFGGKLLWDAYNGDDEGENEELAEVEMELGKKDEDDDVEGGDSKEQNKKAKRRLDRTVFMQSATMTFVAEWGDRSQIATIAMGAAQNPIGVCVGGVLGHCICSGIAVIGGKMLAERISEKVVGFVGGTLFLFFGCTSAYFGPSD
mmetsp:Transcript_42489/g.92724  ORF Transcript_42489/g.92724 Transcript_42489/m.92724 type:complete len:281 (+) Transcript_42489:42-884(+)